MAVKKHRKLSKTPLYPGTLGEFNKDNYARFFSNDWDLYYEGYTLHMQKVSESNGVYIYEGVVDIDPPRTSQRVMILIRATWNEDTCDATIKANAIPEQGDYHSCWGDRGDYSATVYNFKTFATDTINQIFRELVNYTLKHYGTDVHKTRYKEKVRKMSKSQFARRYLNKVAQLKKSKGIKKDYNGWPNYETWGFMLIWNNCGYGQSLYEDIEYRVDDVRNTDEVKDAIRGEIECILEEVDEYIQNGSDFVKQLANCVTNEVDVDRCVEAILDELDIDNRFGKSAKKSKSGIRKYGLSPWSIFGDIDDLVGDITRMYNVWEKDDNGRSSTQESELFNKIDEQMEDLYRTLNAYADELGRLTKSAKKSKYSNIHRSLNKIGGFTKEDDEEEEVPRTIGSKKRRVKMHKESNLPEDADDQQDIEDTGSGNAGSLMPEDAEDVTRSSKRRKGMRKSYRGGDLLTTVHFNDDLLTVAQYLYDAGYRATEEDRATLMGGADEDEQYSKSEVDQIFEYFKQIEDGKSVKRRKGVRKFSVTPGGSPDQTSYIDRYNQAPRVRSAIDSHFSDTQMLQERIDAMGKSRRNSLKNNVPTTLVTTKKHR